MESQKERASFNDVQRYVASCSYPCSKEALIECAREHQAPNSVIQTLQIIRSEKEFNDLNAVKQGIESF